jgi:isopentenyl-diphosphate delta-isomerase type 1
MLKYRDAPTEVEAVVLLDASGRPCGAAPKLAVHGPDTPLHLGFSCYVFDASGRVLVTQRAAVKRTWPSVWTNACCGHPQPGETLRDAVTRRLRDELGMTPRRMALAIPDFTYRAVMSNGVVEHELCPVVVAECDGEPVLNPDEVDDATWLEWDALRHRADRQPSTLSPWSVAQVARLGARPRDRLLGEPGRGLDAPFVIRVGGTTVRAARQSDPLEASRRAVDELLDDFLGCRAAELAAIDAALAPVAAEIGDLVAAGGKRLRPAFVAWGQRASGARDDAAVASVGAAVEMLHTFALIHDDVMDQSPMRRGRPTAATGFARTRAEDGAAGDHERFGVNAAILAGDLAFVWADQLLDAAPLDAAAAARVRAVFTTLRTEVMAGQYLELRLDGVRHADPETARRIALLKSGRYTVTRPLELGLAITGAPPATQRALATYGDAIGLAFQLRDDVLGLFGDPATTGKSRTDDLRAGKRTLLVLRAFELGTPAARVALDRSLGDPALDEDGAARCREIVAGSGALASIETLIREQHAVALDAIEHVPEPARSALTALAAVAVQRER